jgi:MinD superfamily P-loop ATPase
MKFMLVFMVMEVKHTKIAVLSGKGGTGKTLVSVNLAAAAKNSTYIDCDVEEPNGHLFFKPEITSSKKVNIKIPTVDQNLCNGCRVCVDFCKFHALAYVGSKVMVFEDICHSCGGCMLLCPQKAISEKEKSIGEVRFGCSKGVNVISGFLNPGESSGIPIIKKLLEDKNISQQLTLIDCPPGSACIVMESIKDADYCVLVAEPTIFGAHNLQMVYDLVRLFDKPHGVVLNKCLSGDNPSKTFCEENGIKILTEIPFDNRLGTINSNARIAVRENEQYKELFTSLLEVVSKEVQNETTINSQR